jgi:hypothetical protein
MIVSARTWLRYAWTAPNSLAGCVLAVTAWIDGEVAIVNGVIFIEAHGRSLRWMLRHLVQLPGGAAALTLGHVVLATDATALCRTRTHERIHVAQYERWGPLFLPAYAAASCWALVRGEHYYFGNRFERHAWSQDDGATAVRRQSQGEDRT